MRDTRTPIARWQDDLTPIVTAKEEEDEMITTCKESTEENKIKLSSSKMQSYSFGKEEKPGRKGKR